MRLPACLSSALVVVVILSLLVISAALAEPSQGAYGPCCPLVKGQKAPKAFTTAAGTVVTGPSYVCRTKAVTLSYEGKTIPLDAMEAAGSLLVPARLFTMTGANLEWAERRQLVLTRGTQRVELALGSHAVTIYDGTDSRMVSWPLCPRLINGVSYAPLRGLAEALGLAVTYEHGVVTVSSTQAAGATAAAPATCPADRVEEALGVSVVRSPANSNFGVGVGIVDVKPDGTAAGLGVQARDVIIGCNDQPVKCPKDLDQILTQLQTNGGTIRTLVVARGAEKIALQKKSDAQ